MISSAVLQWIAAVSMVVDHVGLYLFLDTTAYEPMRIIGRIAFPLYVFMLTEGFRHTKNKEKYFWRMLIFAFIAQLPMNVTFSDFGNREKFGRIPVPISEDEALLSGYEIGDFSYGTAYDCMIIFYGQDNEIIDGIIKLGSFDSGLDLLSGKENIEVTVSPLK